MKSLCRALDVLRSRSLGISSAVTWSVCAISLALLMTSGSVAQTGDGTPNRIKIEYIPPTKPELQRPYEMLKANRGLERVQEVFNAFKLQADLTIKSTECGMSNAWYQRPTLTICYEYLADILKMTPTETTPDGLTPQDAMLGQFAYVVFHEMGHAMFDQLNVPLFGRPEDAADQFSAYLMMRLGKQDARRLIAGAAYSYKEYVEKTKVVVPTTAFSDVHGAPMQRFYNLLCMGYGGEPALFSDLVQKGYLPESRAPSCRTEYGEVNFAFQQLIRPYLDPALATKVFNESWLPPATADRPPQPGAPMAAK